MRGLPNIFCNKVDIFNNILAGMLELVVQMTQKKYFKLQFGLEKVKFFSLCVQRYYECQHITSLNMLTTSGLSILIHCLLYLNQSHHHILKTFIGCVVVVFYYCFCSICNVFLCD